MRDSGNAKTDRLYLAPAHFGTDSEGAQITLPGFADGYATSKIPILPVNLYDLGVEAGEARGGRGAAPIPARMLVKLAAAPSAFVRHGERFVTYQITFRDLRDALYPPEVSGRQRTKATLCRGDMAKNPRSNQDNQPGSSDTHSRPKDRLWSLPSPATHQ